MGPEGVGRKSACLAQERRCQSQSSLCTPLEQVRGDKGNYAPAVCQEKVPKERNPQACRQACVHVGRRRGLGDGPRGKREAHRRAFKVKETQALCSLMHSRFSLFLELGTRRRQDRWQGHVDVCKKIERLWLGWTRRRSTPMVNT